MKHLLLADYIGAASSAMRKWRERVYIDPFCGPGRIQVEGEDFDRDGGAVVAWRQSVASKAPFTSMLLGDLDPAKAADCGARLKVLGAPVRVFSGAADETVPEMVRAVPKSALCLAYIDPYNLALLSFPMLEALASLPKVDFAVHFSTMDLTRNVDHELNPDRARFDQVAPGWRDAVRASKAGLSDAFLKYWIELVERKGFRFSRDMSVRNNTNHEIYRLVFFARHKLPVKLWADVARSPNLELDF